MLKSNRCHLHLLTPEQLVNRGEESAEKGGYFICKGSEKVSSHPFVHVLNLASYSHSA